METVNSRFLGYRRDLPAGSAKRHSGRVLLNEEA